ncbi:MAG: sulfatase-like hydrolase/transferase [Gemmatimonadetes bacterium]|nr:sulfatase-like hydrolase/transferase [Gemmatimonadota bacterium]MYD25703.1 sulfatase-like hydrolase/transferase [Gemmatimonadota bacterium]
MTGSAIPSRPNVILCICDQLRAFEVGCYGNEVVRTPHLDRLATEGVRFETAVSNNPVCMPARSCLLSGQYSRTCMGALGNYAERQEDGSTTMPEYPVDGRPHLPAPTLPEMFKALGYDTALIGKWHVHSAPGPLGFDYSLYPRVHHRHSGQSFVENDGEEFLVERFSVRFESDQVGGYLRDRGNREQPFFLYYSISPPHMPLMDAPETYLGMYDPADIPLRPNVYRDGRLPYDEHWFKVYLCDFLFYEQNLPFTRKLPTGFDLRHLIALYYGMTTWVDDMVGRLMHFLKAYHLAENTIVVFLSDHGDNLGSHHLFNKGHLIEESIRVPLVFHAPGRLKPRVDAATTAQLIDVMPTLLSLCGDTVPAHVQGRDLASVISGENGPMEDEGVFVETSQGQIGLRTPTHTYGIRVDPKNGKVLDDRECFFDLRSDPYQLSNLRDARHDTELAAGLRDRMLEWHHATPWMHSGTYL